MAMRRHCSGLRHNSIKRGRGATGGRRFGDEVGLPLRATGTRDRKPARQRNAKPTVYGHTTDRFNASELARCAPRQGVEPTQTRESREISVRAAKRETVLDGERRKVGVGDEIS